MSTAPKPKSGPGHYAVFSQQGWYLRLVFADSPDDAVARYNRTKRPGFPSAKTATLQQERS